MKTNKKKDERGIQIKQSLCTKGIFVMKGGTLFEATYDNYIISCKENKCDNKEVYKRYKKTNMENKMKDLNEKLKIIKDDLIEISNLKNNNMKELKTVNIEKYDKDLNDIYLKKRRWKKMRIKD